MALAWQWRLEVLNLKPNALEVANTGRFSWGAASLFHLSAGRVCSFLWIAAVNHECNTLTHWGFVEIKENTLLGLHRDYIP